ncbi:MAG: arsenite methyltransferase [Chloroflexota bacterium]
MNTDQEQLVEQVRARYAEAARAIDAGAPAASDVSGAHRDGEGECFGAQLYDPADRAGLPETAILASLGCGNPIAVADLREGERVLDLGSGGGIDVLLSARRVGPTGRAYGLDMTDEMLALAIRNAAAAGVTNIEFLKGRIEAIPLPAATIDVIISNCVINLAADKEAVFAEMARVLRPGGRIGVSDVVARDDLSPAERAERGSYVGCIAGALSFGEYAAGLRAVGFSGISVEPTHQVADGLFGAIVRATKPLDWQPATRPAPGGSPATRELPTTAGSCGPGCCG